MYEGQDNLNSMFMKRGESQKNALDRQRGANEWCWTITSIISFDAPNSFDWLQLYFQRSLKKSHFDSRFMLKSTQHHHEHAQTHIIHPTKLCWMKKKKTHLPCLHLDKVYTGHLYSNQLLNCGMPPFFHTGEIENRTKETSLGNQKRCRQPDKQKISHFSQSFGN